MQNEEELKSGVEAICSRFRVPGYVFIYLDGDKFKFDGSVGLSAIAPLIMQQIFKGKNA